MKKLRQWLIPRIEKHVRTYHANCECIDGETFRNGVREIYYDNATWIVKEDSNDN